MLMKPQLANALWIAAFFPLLDFFIEILLPAVYPLNVEAASQGLLQRLLQTDIRHFIVLIAATGLGIVIGLAYYLFASRANDETIRRAENLLIYLFPSYLIPIIWIIIPAHPWAFRAPMSWNEYMTLSMGLTAMMIVMNLVCLPVWLLVRAWVNR